MSRETASLGDSGLSVGAGDRINALLNIIKCTRFYLRDGGYCQPTFFHGYLFSQF